MQVTVVIVLHLARIWLGHITYCSAPLAAGDLHNLAGLVWGSSTETLVALTAAITSIPGSRLSSSLASRLSSETNLCGPAWISAVQTCGCIVENELPDPGCAATGGAMPEF
jgi:hypothetical protein